MSMISQRQQFPEANCVLAINFPGWLAKTVGLMPDCVSCLSIFSFASASWGSEGFQPVSLFYSQHRLEGMGNKLSSTLRAPMAGLFLPWWSCISTVAAEINWLPQHTGATRSPVKLLSGSPWKGRAKSVCTRSRMQYVVHARLCKCDAGSFMVMWGEVSQGSLSTQGGDQHLSALCPRSGVQTWCFP